MTTMQNMEAQEKAKADSLSEAEAKAAKEAFEAAAAEAKAKQEAIADYLNGGSTQAPITSTAAPTTNAPRKIPAEDIAAADGETGSLRSRVIPEQEGLRERDAGHPAQPSQHLAQRVSRSSLRRGSSLREGNVHHEHG